MSARHSGDDDRNNRYYVMLSSRGGRPHDDASPPSFKTPGMGADGRGRVLEWEVGLPTAEELMPVSHPLIPRALAAAFQIDVAGAGTGASASSDSPTSHLSLRCDDDDDEDDGEVEEGETTEDLGDVRGAGAACRGGNVLKKRRMVWTPELHHRFVAAVAQLGDKAAVPKAIMEVMNVEGMTREHVASHLQKYRAYLKRTRTTNAAPPAGLPAMPPTSQMTPPTGGVTDRSSPPTATSTRATNKIS